MTPSSFFGTSLRRDPNQPADLNARIEAQLRERLEEAVDFVCLEALVKRRRALSLPAPSADSTRDREEFTQSVHAFLAELRKAMTDDEPLGPREEAPGVVRTIGEVPIGRQRGRFGRRR